jgi:hypothetical protein
VSVNFYLSMWTISSSQLLGDVCSSKSLLVEIEKEKNARTPHRHTSTPAHAMHCTQAMHTPMHRHTLHTGLTQAHTPCTHPCTGTHCTHAVHRHTRTRTALHTHTHSTHAPMHSTHAHRKKLRVKEGNPFKLSFYEAGVAISVRHISSAPKESPTPQWSCKLVEQQLQSWFGGVGALPNTPLLLTRAMLCSFSHTTPGPNQ